MNNESLTSTNVNISTSDIQICEFEITLLGIWEIIGNPALPIHTTISRKLFISQSLSICDF